MFLYDVTTKSNKASLVLASSPEEASKVMLNNGRVRDIKNVSKVVDITDSYKRSHPSFEPSKLKPGMFYAVFGYGPDDFRTHNR